MSEDAPSGIQPSPVGVVAAIKGFIVWVGGSLASITALLYACGYLVARAHLSALGLYGLVEFGNDQFLQEGAKFAVVVGYDLARTALPLLVLGLLVIPVKWLVAKTWPTRLVQRLRTRLPILIGEDSKRRAIYGALFLSLILHADTYLDQFHNPLLVANLLYSDPASPKYANVERPEASWIELALLRDDRAALSTEFDGLLFGAMVAGAFAYGAWRISDLWRQRAWLVAPFMAALALYTVSVPMVYGVLKRPIRYPVIELTMADDARLVGAGPFFLLAKTDADFVVWDAKGRKLIWIPSAAIERAEVDNVRELFRFVPNTQEDAK